MMPKKAIFIIVFLMAFVLSACGSQSITAVELPVEEPQVETAPEMEESADMPVEEEMAAEAAPPPVEASSGVLTFTIVPAESEARFIIEEVLAGSPKTVVGATADVEGSISGDFNDPMNVSMSTITVDLSTLQTDNSFRNGAIHNRILETTNEAFRYGTFEVIRFVGLPERVEIGQPFSFQIVGNLTVHGVTKEVTFDTTVTPVSTTRLTGLASLGILFSEFGVQILSLPPQVASVENDIIIEIEFVAEAQ